MPDTASSPPPVPLHLADRPTIGGLVVPFVTLQHHDGKAALGIVDSHRVELCLRERRCGVCGEVVTARLVFLMRQSDLARGCSLEPGMCPPCAAYTTQACPMVGGLMKRYRGSVSPFATRRCGDEACDCRIWVPPEGSSARPGSPAEPWYALWTTQYRLIRTSQGQLTASFAGLRVLALREVKGRPNAGCPK